MIDVTENYISDDIESRVVNLLPSPLRHRLCNQLLNKGITSSTIVLTIAVAHFMLGPAIPAAQDEHILISIDILRYIVYKMNICP